ncbi:MAG: mechanosensitive ion channel family protein [Patescibacteria group bacterium]|nr:mechanosensitive ion channel family protein [Patescibacteria group bacterium]
MNEIIIKLTPWFNEHGIKILAIFILTFFVSKFSKFFIEKTIRKLITPDLYVSKEAEEKREDTLIQISASAFGIIIWIISILMILQEFGLEIGPVLAAAGIAGLAFGFGGQYLIRDLIAGLFIIIENQYRIGDIICIGDVCGSVENLSLRMTTLRALDGTVHHVPHGEITKVSNKSKNFSRVNLNIGVSYNASIDHVIQTVNKVGEELSSDPDWQDYIIKSPQFLRIDDFADSSVVIKILGETKPSKQWEVTGELRKRIKLAFDKEGIEIPYPQRTVHQL